MFSLELNTKVFWELSGGGDLEKVKRERKREREKGEREMEIEIQRERERQVTHNFHIFLTQDRFFPPRRKVDFSYKK